jgi:hypothetical protein
MQNPFWVGGDNKLGTTNAAAAAVIAALRIDKGSQRRIVFLLASAIKARRAETC